MRPFISIIIPVYNNEKYLPNAINSVLNQSFQDFEIVIVDDGSTDESGKIADDFAKKDKRIKVIHQNNQWIYASFNNGISRSNGEYILVLNSDDTINYDSLRRINEACLFHKYDIVFFNLTINKCDDNQKILEKDIMRYSNLIDSDFKHIGENEVRKNWIEFIKNRLVYRQCVYKENIAKKHKYRNDYYIADQLYNIQIASDIKSVAGLDYIVYNHFHYGNEKMNASVDKYYGYEHEMFNCRHRNHLNLYEEWNLWNENISDVLAECRLSSLSHELKSLNAPNCNLTVEEKLKKSFFEYIDDTVYSIAKENNRIDEMERRVIHGCKNILIEDIPDKTSGVYFIYEMIEILSKDKKTKEDIKKLKKCVYHKDNKYNIGKYFYNTITKK